MKLFACILLLSLSACGIKGDLTRPADIPAQTEQEQ